MNKLCILLLFLSFQAMGQKKYGFDNAGLVEMNGICNGSGTLLIDEHSNKYYCNTFKDKIVFENDTLQVPYISNNNAGFGILIAQFDSQNHYVRCAKIAQGDTIGVSSIQYYKNYIYVSVMYSGKIQLAQDTIVSKGSTDVCFLKFDLNFQLVNYLNIGNYRGEYISNGGLNIKDDHFYFAIDYNCNDDAYFIHDNYSLVLGNDTLHCDTSDVNSQSEYAICEMDTNLQIIQSKSMGGKGISTCISLSIGNNGIYIIGSTSSYVNNHIGGLQIDYSTPFADHTYLAKLDFQFNGIWVRRISSVANTEFYLGKLYVLENNIIFTGSNSSISSYGSSPPTGVNFEQGGLFNSGSGFSELHFICSYDTNGNFQIVRDFYNYYSLANTLFADVSRNKLLISGYCGYNDLVNGEHIIPCNLNADVTVAEYNLFTGDKKHIASLCGYEFEQINKFFLDPFGKIYTLGYTTSDQIITANTTCYSTQFIPTCFYASLDSCVFYPNSVSNQASEESISIIPNPSKGVFKITLPEITESCKVNITDIQGKMVYTNTYSSAFSHSQTTISLPTLPAGNYILRITDASHSLVKKIAIE